ncbi:capsular biosynthesis protein, partial [Acinetobacter baumannii]
FDVNIKRLILKSLGVITVNSTAGYEALLLGKPVYLLGRVFYENFNNVYNLKSYRDIRDIRDILDFQFLDVKKDFIAYKQYVYKG